MLTSIRNVIIFIIIIINTSRTIASPSSFAFIRLVSLLYSPSRMASSEITKMSTNAAASAGECESNDGNDDRNGSNNKEQLPRIVDTVTVGSTKWIKLETLSYKDQEGTDR